MQVLVFLLLLVASPALAGWPSSSGGNAPPEGFIYWGASEQVGYGDTPAPENNDFPGCCLADMDTDGCWCEQSALNALLAATIFPHIRGRIVAYPGNTTNHWIDVVSPLPNDEMHYSDGWTCSVTHDCDFYQSAVVSLHTNNCNANPADPDAELDNIYNDHVTAIDYLLKQPNFRRIFIVKTACLTPARDLLGANAATCINKVWSDTCSAEGDCSKALDTRLKAKYGDLVQVSESFSQYVNSDPYVDQYFWDASLRCHTNGFGQALSLHMLLKDMYGDVAYPNERPAAPVVAIGTVTATTIDVSLSDATDPDGDAVTAYIWAADVTAPLNLGAVDTADRLTQDVANGWLADPTDGAGSDDLPDYFPVAIVAGAGSGTITGLATGTAYKVVAVTFDGKVGSELSIEDVTTP